MTKDTRRIDCGYLIIGHPALTTEFTFFLEGKGLKNLVSQLREGEDVRIGTGEWKDEKGNTHYYNRIEAVDTHHRYSKEEAT